MNFHSLKTAIVYDWIDSRGGIERVIPLLIKEFNADLFTSYFDKKRAPWADKYDIKTSFINNLAGFIKKNRLISLPLYPFAFESFNFSDYNLVISISSSFAKSIITKPNTRHICYMLTPTRYFWVEKKSYFKNLFIKVAGNIILPGLKKWDVIAASRPDNIFSISNVVKKRVKKYYKINSTVIYPPFDTVYWSKIKNLIINKIPKQRSYFLLVSRLEPYKKVEIAIEAFNKLGDKLVIVGNGSQERKLKRLSKKNIKFEKNLSDQNLASLYSGAKALVMPQVEELGMVSLEAQFFGCPVITYKNSGAKETIVEGKTGILFEKQNSNSLITAIVRYKSIAYNLKKSVKEYSLKNIERFDKEKFIYNFKKLAHI